MTTFRKTDNRPGRITYEITGLRWLADTPEAAAPVVSVTDHGDTWLEEPRLTTIPSTDTAARAFGRALAHTHAAGATHLGAPPADYTGNGWMGQADLPLIADPASSPTSWGEFYAQYRMEPYFTAPDFGRDDRALLLKLADKLANGTYDHAQPALVRTPAARTHGDLWSGNILWTARGVTLIDPAAQGGHAEEDLAALALFGCPYLDDIYDSYANESAPEAGFRDRLTLHQLHILLVHCYLFGGSYVTDTITIARRWNTETAIHV